MTQSTLSTGQDLELTIDAMAYGGKGVARFGAPPGKVYFVENAITGDRLIARVTEDNGRYGEAEIVELLNPSPLRGASPCAFSEACGGCQWMGVDYDHQLKWKRSFVESALKRIGKLSDDVSVEIVASPAVVGFRNRILVRAHHDGGTHVKLGYFARKSRRLIPIDQCRVAEPEVNIALEGIRAISLAGLPEFKVRLEIQRIPRDDPQASGQVIITVYPAEGSREATETLVARIRLLPIVRWAGLVFELSEAPTVVLEDDLGLNFRTLPGQFQQVNMALNRTLRRLVKHLSDEIAPKRILDVFCGSGNLSMPLANAERYIEGVEFNKKAILIAKQNVEANGLKNTCYLAGDAEKHLWKCARGGESFDLVILDPPRQGMYQGMVPLKKLSPKHIIYVSCDPTTLARDIGYLCRKDEYKIAKVTALDFFPNTYHVETVVHLSRTS